MYQEFMRPVIDRFDSEDVRNFAKHMLHWIESGNRQSLIWSRLIQGGKRYRSPRLKTRIGNLEFENPLMVGAGWDKDASVARGLYLMGAAGIEIGTVPEYAQSGNYRPRIHRIGDGVAINSMGFNSPGVEVVEQNLQRYRQREYILGINIGKNYWVDNLDAAAAYGSVARRLAGYGDYLAINVSSPNTKGLRRMQERDSLAGILTEVQKNLSGSKKPDLWVKIAPDLSEDAVKEIVSTVGELGGQGLIIANTTTDPAIRRKYILGEYPPGGISGDDADYRKLVNKAIVTAAKEARGELDIIGSGGVCQATHAWEMMENGAAGVQIHTGLWSKGPRIFVKIARELDANLERLGIKNIREITGQKK